MLWERLSLRDHRKVYTAEALSVEVRWGIKYEDLGITNSSYMSLDFGDTESQVFQEIYLSRNSSAIYNGLHPHVKAGSGGREPWARWTETRARIEFLEADYRMPF